MIITTITPFGLAKLRRFYLTDFIISNRIGQLGFANSPDSAAFSNEATADALSILNFYDMYEEPGAWGAIIDNVNLTQFRSSLSSKINPLLDQSGAILYELYDLYRALDLIDYSSSSYISRTKTYLDGALQASGGSAPTNITTSSSIITTFYALELYSIINELDSVNKTLHKDWILNSYNNNGGFGGNSSLPSTLANTYYAILSLNRLGSLSEIPNPTKTIEYLNSFYVSDQSDLINFGGYLPDNYTSITLLSSTYYSTKAISLIDPTQLNNETIISWVLNRQNFEDGGFAEKSEGAEQKTSSVLGSYFAFETLKIFGADMQILN